MDWTPSLHAIHVEALFDPDDAQPGSILVEHFNDPCEVEVKKNFEEAAHGYLEQLLAVGDLRARLRIPDEWITALAPADPGAPATQQWAFGWLPSKRSHGSHLRFMGPYGSFHFESSSDRMEVLFASQCLDDQHYLGSGFGLALIAHVREDGGKTFASFAGLSGTLPHRQYRAPLTRDRRDAPIGPSGQRLTFDWLYLDSRIRNTMAAAANLEGFVVRGIRIGGAGTAWRIERQGVGVRDTGGVKIPYVVTMLSIADETSHTDTITHVAPLVADAAQGHARVFDNDPSSVRGALVKPSWEGLDAERVTVPIFNGTDTGALRHVAGGLLLQVMPSPPYVVADMPPIAPPRRATINRPGAANENNLPIRSDDASAVQAFFHARDLVQRLQAYGWNQPADYFVVTSPEIQVFYRSGISPGPGKDGRCVNARVIPEGWPPNATGRLPNDTTRPAVQIHLALADLRRRDRPRWTAGGPPARASSFGIAADQRWMWHEFGHVLLIASTGELEFRFAHSPGDAMAAIAADPESKLSGTLRTLTFPFVFLPRRHNRCATEGWSWSGTMHAGLRDVPAARHPRRKGYASEQILSSSLFRLYRCIGGDTGPAGPPGDAASHQRHRASHYCLYLILQAMHLMGDVRTQVVATPAQFVRLLREADRQNGEWVATFPGAPPYRRMGGTATKVIRWAFEAQGLYGDGDGPGQPEPVDIYIRSQRRTTDTDIYGQADYGHGSYVPVSLHWPPNNMADPPGEPSRWHADRDEGIVHRGDNGEVVVLVRNRGSAAPQAQEVPIEVTVTVTLWYARWDDTKAPPAWNPNGNGWTQCNAVGQATQVVPWDAPQAFTFTFAPAAGRYILFAQATCAEDHAITDPAMGLACSTLATPLEDLVPNDNNLGLLVVKVT